MPTVIRNLGFIKHHLDYKLVMVTNQDGLGTSSFPEETFWPVHNFVLDTLKGEGITFDDILLDRHFPEDNSPMRKPGTGMVKKYMDEDNVDIAGSYVIGDRESDAQLAENMGCKSLILGKNGMTWNKIAEILFAGERIAEVHRVTKETDVFVRLNLDGSGKCDVMTGLGFFDHMLEQIGHHGMIDITVHTKGDLYVDEHHTIEDTGLALGECILKALGDKRGIERYGFVCQWMIAYAKWRSISVADHGLCGMPSSSVRKSGKCLPRCFPFLQELERCGQDEPQHKGRRHK